MENILHQLCKAGSYIVDDPEDARLPDVRAASPQVLNIERSYIDEHIASCRNVIVEWTTKNNGPSHHTVLTQVSRIDLAIRGKWTDMYRTHILTCMTFTSCIRKTKATAENTWVTDLTRDMSSATSPDLSTRDKRERVARLAAEKKKAKSRGKGAGKGAKGAKNGTNTNPQAANLTLGNPLAINGKKVKTAKSRGNKAYCI